MDNRDYLCYLIYMFADYMFSDATLVNGRIDIYDEYNNIVLWIYVNGDTSDSIKIVEGFEEETAEAFTVMNIFISFIRMIHDRYNNPFGVIRRLVSVNE